MYGGTITGNNCTRTNADAAGGVKLSSNGAMYMKGGSVTGNTYSYNGGTPADI
jgi:hypothetical protein